MTPGPFSDGIAIFEAGVLGSSLVVLVVEQPVTATARTAIAAAVLAARRPVRGARSPGERPGECWCGLLIMTTSGVELRAAVRGAGEWHESTAVTDVVKVRWTS
ncbi:hypothetical protein GCM10027062_26290 [Nocardioides hungaricus]